MSQLHLYEPYPALSNEAFLKTILILTLHALKLCVVCWEEWENSLCFSVTVYIQLQVGQHGAETGENTRVEKSLQEKAAKTETHKLRKKKRKYMRLSTLTHVTYTTDVSVKVHYLTHLCKLAKHLQRRWRRSTTSEQLNDGPQSQ